MTECLVEITTTVPGPEAQGPKGTRKDAEYWLSECVVAQRISIRCVLN
jgi:hypothetical protein